MHDTMLLSGPGDHITEGLPSWVSIKQGLERMFHHEIAMASTEKVANQNHPEFCNMHIM